MNSELSYQCANLTNLLFLRPLEKVYCIVQQPVAFRERFVPEIDPLKTYYQLGVTLLY